MNNHHAPILQTLSALKQDGRLRPLDYQFARLIHDMDDQPLLAVASALVSHELAQGNVCLHLGTLDKKPLFGLDKASQQTLFDQLPDSDWISHLQKSAVVGNGSAPSPLVLDCHRLYLYRYWQYEQTVAQHLGQKKTIDDVDHHQAKHILDRLFQRDYSFIYQMVEQTNTDEDTCAALIKWLDIPENLSLDWPTIIELCQHAESYEDLQPLEQLIPDEQCLNWQKVAAALAATQSFSVISGGPGTGKTTTVTRLLAMLIELGLSKGHLPDIRLVAPTGKASARLTESIGGALDKLNCSDEVRHLIPNQAGTIHRLLGVIPNSTEFRHNASNPLHLDILVVDEASMVDLPMMTRLLEALPDHARIILLGDRDQLASVEAGSVLGDICEAADLGYSPEQNQRLQALTGYNLNSYKSKGSSTQRSHNQSSHNKKSTIQNSFCLLHKSYRFDASSGIGSLASAINSGHRQFEKTVWESGFSDIRRHPMNDTGYADMLKLCVKGYRIYLDALNQGQSPTEVLKAFNRFRLLCALREGRYGVEGLNLEIRQVLARQNLIEHETLWYSGRPVLITRNDHGLGLYNGDIGITMPSLDGRLRVVFQLPDGTIKSLLPSRLPEHETVFAMTIHKSQGSEFDHTAIVLPETMNPVLTRELVYTGITRAKKELDIFTTEAVLSGAIANPTLRVSGLKERFNRLT